MQEWFMNLDGTMQIFWGIALVASLIFIIQTIMTFIGIDSVDGMDVDVDVADGDTMDTGGAMSLFSIRSMVNILVGFGWSGVCLRSVIGNTVLLYVVAVIVGLLMGYAYIFMWRKMRKLESNGAIDISQCVGKEGDVYLRIQGEKKGRGKVQVSINGSLREFDAMTEGEDIPTGQRVRIQKADGTVVIVEKA